MPLPERFDPGEFADVSGQLNRNFDYLYQLILSGGTGGSAGRATGAATVQGFGRINGIGVGNANGVAVVNGFSNQTSTRPADGAAVGTAIANGIGSSRAAAAGSANGLAIVSAFDSNSGTGDGSSAGVATVTAIGLAEVRRQGIATGTATVVGASAKQLNTTGTAPGIAVVQGVSTGSATESADGAVNTGPSTPTIFASTVPGTGSSTLNSFSLSGFNGTVLFNGVADTDTDIANAAKLYYTGHVLYVVNVSGNWFRWVSANNWVPATNPLPSTITESVEGFTVSTAGPIIYGNSVLTGVAAPLTATVGNGLIAWTMTGNPGQLRRDVGLGPSTDTNTANVVQMYYHNHILWHQNSALEWYTWDNGPSNGYTGPQPAGPVPTTAKINVANMLTQNVNDAFAVSGTYQAYPGTPSIPVLQYADNFVAGGQTTTWSTTDKSASITLTNVNQAAASTQTAVSASVRSNTSFSTGKKIFEITANTLTTNFCVGMALSTFNLASGLGDGIDSFAIQPNFPGGSQAFIFGGAVVNSSAGHNSANGDKFTFCVDLDADKVWFTSAAMRAAGFPWNNAVIGSQNPATGTGGFSITGMGGNCFICFNEFDTGGSATINTTGGYAVTIPTGFVSWDVGSSTTWLSLPGNGNVTPTTWSFVHPPVATQNPTATVAVRDQNNTGVAAVSNSFQIQTPGVTTLNPMTLSNTTVAAGQPSGTLVGVLTIPTSGGIFNGTVTTSVPSQFAVNGTGGTRQLVTSAVLGASAGIPLVITATQGGAVNSPEILSVTIVVSAESGTATSVTTVGPTIVGSSTPGVTGAQLTWGLVAAVAPATGLQITLNGTRQTVTSSVAQLYYINHTLYQSFGTSPATTWSFYNGTTITGGQLQTSNFTTCPTPIPSISLNTQNFAPETNGDTGILATLISAGNVMSGVTWTENSAQFTFITGNHLSTTGTLPQGKYSVDITATIT